MTVCILLFALNVSFTHAMIDTYHVYDHEKDQYHEGTENIRVLYLGPTPIASEQELRKLIHASQLEPVTITITRDDKAQGGYIVLHDVSDDRSPRGNVETPRIVHVDPMGPAADGGLHNAHVGWTITGVRSITDPTIGGDNLSHKRGEKEKSELQEALDATKTPNHEFQITIRPQQPGEPLWFDHNDAVYDRNGNLRTVSRQLGQKLADELDKCIQLAPGDGWVNRNGNLSVQVKLSEAAGALLEFKDRQYYFELAMKQAMQQAMQKTLQDHPARMLGAYRADEDPMYHMMLAAGLPEDQARLAAAEHGMGVTSSGIQVVDALGRTQRRAPLGVSEDELLALLGRSSSPPPATNTTGASTTVSRRILRRFADYSPCCGQQ